MKAPPLSAGLRALRRRTATPFRPPRGWWSHDLAAGRTTWREMGGGGEAPLCPQRPTESAGGSQGPGPGCRTLKSAVFGPTVVWGTTREGRRVGRRFPCPPPALRAVAAPSPVTGRCGPRSLPLCGGEEGTESLVGGSPASGRQLHPRPALSRSSSRSSPLTGGGWAAGSCPPSSPATPRGPVGWYGPAVSVCQLPAATGRAGAGSPEPR